MSNVSFKPPSTPSTPEGLGPRELPPLPRASALAPSTPEGLGPRELPPLPRASASLPPQNARIFFFF